MFNPTELIGDFHTVVTSFSPGAVAPDLIVGANPNRVVIYFSGDQTGIFGISTPPRMVINHPQFWLPPQSILKFQWKDDGALVTYAWYRTFGQSTSTMLVTELVWMPPPGVE